MGDVRYAFQIYEFYEKLNDAIYDIYLDIIYDI
jgi:hypothetical protein